MLIFIPILAVLCTSGLWVVLGRPRFTPLPGKSEDVPQISIVIPARNEEANIATLLESIRDQTLHPFEVIVADDGSSDRTAEIAGALDAKIITVPAQPGGWKGKTWACQQGAAHATGQWLLFLDADTRLAPAAMERFARLSSDPGRVVSICPDHHIHRPYEELSAFFNVIMIAGINSFGIQRSLDHDSALFGQCMLIPSRTYQKLGGHGAVRGEILENFNLARHLEAAGIPRSNYLGRGCVTMRMFPGGLGGLWSSWKKGFTSGAQRVAPRILMLTSLWLTGGMLVIIAVAFAALPDAPITLRIATLLAYLIYASSCIRAFRLAGNYSWLNAICFPISLLFYQTLFFTAIIERKLGIKTRWKGRHVD